MYRIADTHPVSNNMTTAKKRKADSAASGDADVEADVDAIPIVSSQSAAVVQASAAAASKKSASQNSSRPDGRTPLQLRPIACEVGHLQRAHGSARYTQGATHVMAAVYMTPTPITADSNLSALLQVICTSMHPTTQGTHAEVVLAQQIRHVFKGVILLNTLPRTQIQIAIQVLANDGSLLAVAINAAQIALADAGVECRFMAAAVSICILRVRLPTSDAKQSKDQVAYDDDETDMFQSHKVFDSVEAEESTSTSTTMTFAFSPDAEPAVLLTTTTGYAVGSWKTYVHCLKLAHKAAQHLQLAHRKFISQPLVDQSANAGQ